MSSKRQGDLPAFPCEPNGGCGPWDGMTLRDYFAAKAMAALIAKIPLHDRQGEHGIHAPEVSEIHQVRLDVAQSAFDYADAMIAEREKARPQ